MTLIATSGFIVQPDRLSKWLKHEYALDLCRELGVLAPGEGDPRTVVSGQVLGAVPTDDGTGVEIDVYVALDPAGVDGSEVAAGVAIHDATAGDGVAGQVLVLNGGPSSVDPVHLIWPDGITASQKAKAIRELRDIGIRAAP
ncbi:MAG TPA: head decoration protein [Brevundimonas diminuta]|nr:head decoration protein [Brevundimonas diminuta]